MKLDALVVLFKHISQRETSHGIRDAFRFKAVLTSRKKGELGPTHYEEDGTHSENAEDIRPKRRRRKRRQQVNLNETVLNVQANDIDHSSAPNQNTANSSDAVPKRIRKKSNVENPSDTVPKRVRKKSNVGNSSDTVPKRVRKKSNTKRPPASPSNSPTPDVTESSSHYSPESSRSPEKDESVEESESDISVPIKTGLYTPDMTPTPKRGIENGSVSIIKSQSEDRSATTTKGKNKRTSAPKSELEKGQTSGMTIEPKKDRITNDLRRSKRNILKDIKSKKD
jgi:hypothetical protein